MTDRFASYSSGLDSPGTRHFAITPSANDLNPRPRSLYCEAAGTVTIQDADLNSLTYTLQQGQVLPFRGRRITAATATVYGWE